MYVIEAVDLTKIYHNRYIALNALNLRVEKGMVYGFVGPNGAGKSTTFRIILGLQRATAGELQLFGEPMRAEARGPAAAGGLPADEPLAAAQHDPDLLPPVRR